ncbi:uncharacterized protein Z519_01052 [Cladophialophora bantiana CBS 173.52]|uniref:Uncharacterized protein n=1 Tax=Cladophialophora bantiana (strain ATCC 10958 / CBS 173.52 / CDC B-1940 / NIH 8579) TaxID=1442370 RepID=A0A0D2HVS9_CLAB1|nr:uncharacterized protein Z519_01052 [Cladophialophora bantiana CBS 173.52]KIW97468.1 hypothetical protein Z519_01052 [Cladophialophora bantiana CBS 173.52]
MSFHALWKTVSFNRPEKDGCDTDDGRKKLGRPIYKIASPQFNNHGATRYSEYLATVTFMCAFYGVLALTSLVTAETTIRDLLLQHSFGIDSSGQVIALVTAAVAVLGAG